jgi:hypothetical protein
MFILRVPFTVYFEPIAHAGRSPGLVLLSQLCVTLFALACTDDKLQSSCRRPGLGRIRLARNSHLNYVALYERIAFTICS